MMSLGKVAAFRVRTFSRMVGPVSARTLFTWKDWAKVDVPASTGIVKPLLAAVPPGGLPRMAACGWLSVGAADAMGVALVVFRGVDSFEDFTETPEANVVKSVSREAKKLGISVGMLGEEALQILESAPPTGDETATQEKDKGPCASHAAFDGWTQAELPVSTGIPKPLLVAVPPGGKPCMAACGWVEPDTADKLGVSLLVYKGVSSFQDFVVEGAPTSNSVKVASKSAQELGIAEGASGESPLSKLAQA